LFTSQCQTPAGPHALENKIPLPVMERGIEKREGGKPTPKTIRAVIYESSPI
jgi:hypothetical protein